jgi:hypothetical protein
MGRSPVHYEVFTRHQADGPWGLQFATEDRGKALETASHLLERAMGVKVFKETLDEDTREYRSVSIFSKGSEAPPPRPKTAEAEGPACVSPQDLYTNHAREKIGRVLDGWLRRRGVTPFELLHRADLAEALDASGVELQHALQKIAIAEARMRGGSTHEQIRSFLKLSELAMERVMRDARRGLFPTLKGGDFGDVALSLHSEGGERAYRLGGAVAQFLISAKTWPQKIARLLDLADAAPDEPRARALALGVLEPPLAEILASSVSLAELVGDEADLGGALLLLARLSTGHLDDAARVEPGDPTAEFSAEAERLGGWLRDPAFQLVRAGLARRVLRELKGPRRLRPTGAEQEIACLVRLASVLAAGAGPLLPDDDVQQALIERSKSLVAADFVTLYLADQGGALNEAEALIRLSAAVVGGLNKQAAGRWLAACVCGLRFEREVRGGEDSPAARLSRLAALQRSLGGAGLASADSEEIARRIGEAGGWVEADANLSTLISRSQASGPQKLVLLLALAAGDAAPLGPAAQRARGEALKLLRLAPVREALKENPAQLDRVRVLAARAGLGS